jgi:hypothetical protein
VLGDVRMLGKRLLGTWKCMRGRMHGVVGRLRRGGEMGRRLMALG